MTGIVVPTMGGLPVPAIGRPPPRQPRCLTAGPRAVPITAVAAAAHGRLPLAPPTVTHMEYGDLAGRHRSLQRWRTGQPLSGRAKLQLSVLVPRLRLGGAVGRNENPGPKPGFSLSRQPGELTPPRPPFPPAAL